MKSYYAREWQSWDFFFLNLRQFITYAHLLSALNCYQ